LPQWFIDFEKNDIKYFAASVKINAVSYRKSLMNKIERIPENYYDFIDTVATNNHQAKLSPYYVQYLAQLASHFLLTDSLQNLSTQQRLKALYPQKLQFFDEKYETPIRDLAYADLISTEMVGNYLGDPVFINNAINKISDSAIKKQLNLLRIKMTEKQLTKGDNAPGFSLINESDSLVDLSDFRGKVVLLAFGTTWCKPCIKEIPYEKELYNALKPKGFELISICLGSSEQSWKKLIADHDLTTVNLYANENWTKNIESKYSINSYPHYTLIDQQCKIIESNTANPSELELRRKILEALE